MGAPACDQCGAHLPLPFRRWNERVSRGTRAPGVVRCGVCGRRYEFDRAAQVWRAVADQPISFRVRGGL